MGRAIGHSEAVWAADRVRFTIDRPDDAPMPDHRAPQNPGGAMIGVFPHPGDVALLVGGEIELREKEVENVVV